MQSPQTHREKSVKVKIAYTYSLWGSGWGLDTWDIHFERFCTVYISHEYTLPSCNYIFLMYVFLYVYFKYVFGVFVCIFLVFIYIIRFETTVPILDV